jgi:hypothetical protein
MLRLAAVIPFVLVGCVDTGDEGLYVLTNTAVTGTSCVLSGNPDQAMLGHGVINADSPNAYVMTPLVQSRLSAGQNIDDVSRTIQLRGADVTLTLKAVSVGLGAPTQPDTTLGQLSVLFSGAVPPSGSVNAFVNIIPPSTLREIASMAGGTPFNAEVLASVVIKGDINGNSIKSQPYLYPVTVCSDCVINRVGPCTEFTGTPRTGNACNMFQDGVVDCCATAEGLVCPAVAMTPPP